MTAEQIKDWVSDKLAAHEREEAARPYPETNRDLEFYFRGWREALKAVLDKIDKP